MGPTSIHALTFIIFSLIFAPIAGFQSPGKLGAPRATTDSVPSAEAANLVLARSSAAWMGERKKDFPLLARKSPEPERKKSTWFELVILYMTPWRNPNSIFVYMLATLYILGKYSEARGAAGGF